MANLFQTLSFSSDTASTNSRHAPNIVLPGGISSAFSRSADTLLMWANNERFFIRCLLPELERSVIQLDGGDSIHGIAESGGTIAIVVTRADATALLVTIDVAQFQSDNSNGRSRFPLQRTGVDVSSPLCLSISANGRLVAVGFGENAVLVTLDVPEQSRYAWFTVKTPQTTERVGFQVCSFSSSPDDETLVFSTHMKIRGGVPHGTRDDTVYTSFWPTTTRPDNSARTELATCQILTSGIGLTTVHYSPTHQTAFVTAFTDHPTYKVFLGLDGVSWDAPSSSNLKIPCAAALESKVYFADNTNALWWADMRARTLRPISKGWLKRVKKKLDTGEQIASIGITTAQPTRPALLRCLCKKRHRLRYLQTPVQDGTGDAGFVLEDITSFWGVRR
ncbi:hypothetical protein B0T14DRAFT_605788 [Immersiella caudata]|uniref:Uncharacterized protein n=1 Tax=Immersiella caudata TaxID=314043 RepID=A0AA39WD58_9PEZI|nr:hypothetical protein B0T14DRAFT_605788 [Immersiella caudata]